MVRPSALLILPSHSPSEVGQESFLTSSQLLTQSREDLHLAEGVARALRATGYGPLRDVEVTVHARLVILAGRMPSYHMKQVAQTIALAVPGVHQVQNDLQVGRPT
jgi:osmotically-inducible protein OsmY